MSSSEFYKLTPRQYRILMDRHIEHAEHEQLLFGIVASCIANYAGKHLKEGTTVAPADFMPLLRAKKYKHTKSLPKELVTQNIRNFLWAQVKAQQGEPAR